MPTPTESLIEFLRSHKCDKVEPIAITIKGTRYMGARYTDRHDPGRVRLYLLGDLPACYRRSSRTVFRFPGDEQDWYIAAHINADRITPENARFHPGGANFMLIAWDASDPIDHYENRPRTRVVVTLEN